MIRQTQNSAQEFTPKRSAFFHEMKKAGLAPYHHPVYDALETTPTPTANRGVTILAPEYYPAQKIEAMGFSSDKDYQPKEDFRIIAVGEGAKAKLIRVPVCLNDINASVSFIDWINFTFKKLDYFGSVFSMGVSEFKDAQLDMDSQIVYDLSRFLVAVFGYGVTAERSKGMYFYQKSFDLGPVDKNWGQVCIGGQNESVMVSFSAQGLLAAKPGWEQRLYDFATKIPNAKITRVDLAHDAFNSAKSLTDYFQMYLADLFSLSWRRPSVEKRGDWVNENDKGRTLYVGKRQSGKLLRIYEKGLQLGGGFSTMFPNWVRVELELHNEQRDLPWDILLKPGSYLSGGYPALQNICTEQEVLETRKKSLKLTVDRLIEVTRHQFGKYIHFVSSLFGIEQAFQILTQDKEQTPKRLDTEDYASFDPKSFLDNSKITFKPMTELLAAFGNSFLNYEDFKTPVPF